MCEIEDKFKFWIHKQVDHLTEEKINVAICFVVADSNGQLCFTRLSEICGKFFPNFFVYFSESFRGNVSPRLEPFVSEMIFSRIPVN